MVVDDRSRWVRFSSGVVGWVSQSLTPGRTAVLGLAVARLVNGSCGLGDAPFEPGVNGDPEQRRLDTEFFLDVDGAADQIAEHRVERVGPRWLALGAAAKFSDGFTLRRCVRLEYGVIGPLVLIG